MAEVPIERCSDSHNFCPSPCGRKIFCSRCGEIKKLTEGNDSIIDHFKTYRGQTSTHEHKAHAGGGWVIIAGLEKNFDVAVKSNVEVFVHAHAIALDGARVDLGIHVDDGKLAGTDGFNPPQLPGWGCVGMGLSHCNQWVPIVSIASFVLDQGRHKVDVRLRNPAAGIAQVNGAGWVIKSSPE